ncbi:MAG: sigma-54 dependent transcriptional regulator [Polyangiaceae bacterium]
MTATILFVDDDSDQCALMESLLARQGYDVRTTTSPSEALDILSREDVKIVLTDLGMAEMDGLELCERIRCARPDAAVIVTTGLGSLDSAVAAIRAGAIDFLTKPIDPQNLSIVLDRARKHRQLSDEVIHLRRAAASEVPSTLIGRSAPMRRVHDLLVRVSATDASVLIHGETGTGKELVARALHTMSDRRDKPFVAINCAAVPPTLLESELFGHARGAFTDAKQARQGLFTRANGGTLFLDEIGEMPVELQPKLLRALQERVVRPVGDSVEVPFDARLVVATNRDLEHEVYERRFREDLYYRINVVRVDLPPLRDRGEDILVLASHFFERFAKQSGKTLSMARSVTERLRRYDWPGNVRELENAMERLVALARPPEATPEDLPERIRNYRADQPVLTANDATEVVTVDELERRYILRVLTVVRGNKSRAAQVLGLDRRTLYRKLERYQSKWAPPEAAASAMR